jgi:hypothetical protein
MAREGVNDLGNERTGRQHRAHLGMESDHAGAGGLERFRSGQRRGDEARLGNRAGVTRDDAEMLQVAPDGVGVALGPGVADVRFAAQLDRRAGASLRQRHLDAVRR